MPSTKELADLTLVHEVTRRYLTRFTGTFGRRQPSGIDVVDVLAATLVALDSDIVEDCYDYRELLDIGQQRLAMWRGELLDADAMRVWRLAQHQVVTSGLDLVAPARTQRQMLSVWFCAMALDADAMSAACAGAGDQWSRSAHGSRRSDAIRTAAMFTGAHAPTVSRWLADLELRQFRTDDIRTGPLCGTTATELAQTIGDLR